MSRLPFEFFLALRYLRPKRTFVSVITLISIIGVTLGVAVLIVVISVMTGFDRELRDRILGFNAHIRVYQPELRPMTGYRELMEIIKEQPEVTGVAPIVTMPVLVEKTRADGMSIYWSPWIRGVDPEREGEVSDLPGSVIAGSFDLEGNGVLLGIQLANHLGASVGDVISIYSPENFKEMKESQERGEDVVVLSEEYEVRGIFDVGFYEFNANRVICSLENAQDMSGFEQDAVHALQVMIKDPFRAEIVKRSLMRILGDRYRVSTWADENSEILNALMVEKNVMFYILFFIMIVATFGIMGTMIAFVVQKTREIGILKSLGAGRFQVMGLFLSQSVLVGVIGVLTGLGLGMLAIHYRNDFLNYLREATGFELFPAEIYNFTQLPAMIIPSDVTIICGAAMLMCLLAGIIPAWNAGRLQPVEALHHE